MVVLLVLVLIAERDKLMLHTEGERRPTDLNTRLLSFRAALAFRSLVYCNDGLIS